jgi:phage terminase large subunit-like protein
MVLPCRETDGAWDVYLKSYLPVAALTEHRHADLYRQFRDGGWLTITSGEVVDYRFVETDILDFARRLTVRGVNVDTRFQGIQVATQLQERGLDVREFPQTHASFAAPMKELERLVKTGRLHHGGNPILRWAMDHLVVDIDSHGDAKPSKTRASEKIDPVVALTMALDLAIRQPPREPQFQMFIFRSNQPRPRRW